MQSFRKKYIYNPENPIYSSNTVKTYNCMNTETKDKRLIILEHLDGVIPDVDPYPGILQPIQTPSVSEPFSVYPITRCVSQIGRTGEAEAMYVLKSLLESKMEKPLYSVISSQGICKTNIEGILPSKSPDVFNLAIDMLGLPADLVESEKRNISKDAYSIVRGIKNGENVLDSISMYGWKDVKKEKDIITDNEFTCLKGRRKEDGPFGDDYGLAWHNQHGLCRLKFINLSRDGYEEESFQAYAAIMNYFQENNNKKINILKVHKFQKESKGIKVFTQVPVQGTLSEYIAIRQQFGKPLSEKNFSSVLQNYIQSMAILSEQFKLGGIGVLHIKNIFVHGNKICLGEPLLVTDKSEKKLRELKNSMDYYAPELKQNIIVPENVGKLDREKMDIWCFGFLLHKIFTGEVPIFDSEKEPVISKNKISTGLEEMIRKCLHLNPSERPRWKDLSMEQIERKAVLVQDVIAEDQKRKGVENIRLGSRNQKRQKLLTPSKKKRQMQIYEEEEMKQRRSIDDEEKLKPEDDQEDPYSAPVPTEISSRLKKIKLVVKIILVLLLYTFVFFRQFLGNSIDLLIVRSYYSTTSLHLVDNSNSRLSTTTVLTDDPKFFLQNDISFAQIQDTYHCIDDHFDPIENPDYSLLSYIQSSQFLALLLCGWLMFLIICVTKAVSIWKGGISNRPHKNQGWYWAIYAFHELSLAALLFSHFFIFQFFYFSGASPCLSIENFENHEPLFDSSLYLFLSNVDGYFLQVFSSLGVLSILLLFSSCFYACGPKLDQKYFCSCGSILFRIIPFILLLLMCRIGVFFLFAPTAINDETQIIPAVLGGSATGFLGIIPEVFILICITVEALLELLLYWCESKAAQSDQLSKMFNIKKKKIMNEDSLHDMSMANNSKHKLQVSSIEQY